MLSNEISHDHRLLLSSCLVSDSDFETVFKKWESSIELDDIDYGSMRLIPFIYRRLEKLKLSARDFGRIKGIYTRFWAMHHIKGTPALDALAELDFDYLVLKGTALQTLAYSNDPATRPSDDVDILVHPRDREDALDKLLAAGFELEVPLDREVGLHLRKGFSLVKGGITVDLHWSVFHWSADIKLIDRFFERAITIDYRGRPLRSLGVTDTLFHTLIHGYGTNSVAPIRWVLDAAKLIERGDIDWPLLQREAIASGWGRVVAEQLRVLTDLFNVTVPQQHVDEVRARSSRWRAALQKRFLLGQSVWDKRWVRILGWDSLVLATNLQRRASWWQVLRLMIREYFWLAKHQALAKNPKRTDR